MLEIKDLTKVYRTRGGADVVALNGVSLEFEDTGMVFLLGKSGSGKSTLLNLIGGLDRPDGGEIIVKGRGSATFSTSDFDSYRNTLVGFIFQEYNILNEFTVEDNIALALELQGKPKDREKIASILRSVEMEAYAKRKPNTLSGGQKQRIAIARALVKDPEIIMADEPTGALDSATGKQVFETLKRLSESRLVIVVSHDREFAETYGDRIIELKDGKVVSDVTKHRVAPKTDGENISFLGDNTISVKSGAKLTDRELERISKFITSASEDVLITHDSGDIEAFRRQARIDADGAREQFENTVRENISVREYSPDESRFIRSRLPLRHAIKIGASSLKIKPFRLFFTILLTTAAFVMFGLFSTLMLFDGSHTIAESLKMSDYEYIICGKRYSYVSKNYLGDELMSEVSGTKAAAFKDAEAEELWNDVSADAVMAFNYSDANYSRVSFTINNVVGEKEGVYKTALSGFGVTSKNSFYREKKILWGSYPDSADEVMISDYTYAALRACEGVKFGDETVKINNYDDLSSARLELDTNLYFRICGVYEAQKVPEKYISQGVSYQDIRYEWERELSSGFYNFAIVSDDFYETNFNAFRNQSDAESPYDYFVTLSDFKLLGWDGFVYSVFGASRYPAEAGYQQLDVYGMDGNRLTALGDGSIAVSSYVIFDKLYNSAEMYFAESGHADVYDEWMSDENGISISGKLDIVYSGKDDYGYVSDETRAKYLSDVVAFFVENGIVDSFAVSVSDGNGSTVAECQVAGVFFNNLFDAYCYASDDAYSALVASDSNAWRYEEYTAYDKTGDKYNLAIFDRNNRVIDEMAERMEAEADDSFVDITNPLVSQIMVFMELIAVLSKVFLYVGIAFAVFSMLLLFNFISVSIVNKKKEIGILRAVGARSADVFRIFFAESAIITLTCLVAAIIISAMLCASFNSMIAAELTIPLALFVFGPLSVLIMVVIAVLTSVISTFLPVYSIAKKRPVESIRAL